MKLEFSALALREGENLWEHVLDHSPLLFPRKKVQARYYFRQKAFSLLSFRRKKLLPRHLLQKSLFPVIFSQTKVPSPRRPAQRMLQ